MTIKVARGAPSVTTVAQPGDRPSSTHEPEENRHGTQDRPPGAHPRGLLLGLAIAYGLVALGGTWKPALGLDLQGGTRITLIAKGNPRRQARRGARHHRPARQRLRRHRGRGHHAGQPAIVVEIPGKSRGDLVDTVKRQAQLRFRLVACTAVPRRRHRHSAPRRSAPARCRVPRRPPQPSPSDHRQAAGQAVGGQLARTAAARWPTSPKTKASPRRPPARRRLHVRRRRRGSASPPSSATPRSAARGRR